jgi:hypothetical protein
MEIQVKMKQVYGVERIYPANETAQLMANLLNCKTFTRRQISDMKALGFFVTQVMESVAL